MTFAIDTSAIPGYQYSSLSMNGEGSLTAIDSITLLPVNVIVKLDKATFTVDFKTATTRKTTYKIDLELYDGLGNQVGETQTILVGVGADTDTIRRTVATALENLGLTTKLIEKTTKLEIFGDPIDFGTLEYDTYTEQTEGNWVQNSKIAGPSFAAKLGDPTFNVNGNSLHR